jgi:hypothetical protein
LLRRDCLIGELRLTPAGTFSARGNVVKAPANLAQKLATFTDRFSPRTVATYNTNDIMVAKLEGPFTQSGHSPLDIAVPQTPTVVC